MCAQNDAHTKPYRIPDVWLNIIDVATFFFTQRTSAQQKVKKINEVVGEFNGKIQFNTIFKYERYENIYSEGDEVMSVRGEFKHVNSISKELSQRLLKRGAKNEDLNRFFFQEEGK